MSEAQSKVKEIVVSHKRKPIRKLFKSFVDVKTWCSYDEVSANVNNIWTLFRRLFSQKQGEARRETYEEAVARLELTPEQIITRKNNFLYAAIIYAIFAIGFFAYSVYLVVHAKIFVTILSLIPLVLMVLTAYREHFWYMQMHKKRLGCDFHDWLSFILGRKGQ